MDLALGQNLAAMWDLDVKTGAFTWQAQAAELLDVTGGDLPMTAAGLAAAVHADDAAAVLQALGELTTSGSAEVMVRVGPDTNRRFLSLRGKVLDPGPAGPPGACGGAAAGRHRRESDGRAAVAAGDERCAHRCRQPQGVRPGAAH